MSPEQFQTFLEHNEKGTAAAIEKFVNGGIRAVDAKLNHHIEQHAEDTKRIDARFDELKVIGEAYRGGLIVGEFVKWIAGVSVAAAALWGIFLK